MGSGAVMVFIELCRIYSRLGVRIMLHHGAAAMLAAMIYQLSIIVFQLYAFNMIVNPLFPFGIYLAFTKTLKSLPAKPLTSASTPNRAIMSKVILTTLVQGVALGLGMGMLLHWSNYMAEPRLVGSFCSGIAAIAILFTASKLKANFTSMIYLVGFPLMALGFLAMACFPRILWLGNAIQAVGLCFQYVAITSLFVYLTRSQHLSIEFVSGWDTGSLYFGQVVGGCAGSLVTANLLSLVPFEAVASSTCALLLMLALYISNTNRLAQGWEMALPGASDDTIESRIRALSADVGPTARQEEIYQKHL